MTTDAATPPSGPDRVAPVGDEERNVVFAAPADDPRARRPVDVAILITSVLVTAIAGWLYRRDADVDRRVWDFFTDGVPGWILAIANMTFAIGGLYAVALIVGIALFGHGRGSIARDMVVAMLLVVGLVVVAAYLAGPEFPDILPEWGFDGAPSYPTVRLAAAVAAIRVAHPYLSVPMRTVGHRLVGLTALSTLVLTYGTVTAVIGGVALGAAAAAAVHLLFGSGLGIPSHARVVAALRDAHLDVAGVTFLPQQPVGATLARAELTDGTSLFVKVYGRDAADAALAERVWRAMWYRGVQHGLRASSEQLAEHESLIMLACERAELPAPHLVTWTRAATDDTVIVSRWIRGTPLGELTTDEIDADILDEIWRTLEAYHAAGFVHRDLHPQAIVVSDDGAVFTDLSEARILGGDDEKSADIAQLLAATAAVAGVEPAIDAARRMIGDDRLSTSLAFLQPAALPRELQRQAKEAGLKIVDVRQRTADELGIDAPEVVPLQRVTWGGIAMVGLTAFAAVSLISSLTSIGLDTIADELADARWGWVAVALAMAQLTNVGEYITLAGVIGRPIPFGPTIMFRYALSFISLAVPSDAGAIAMNIRYQQKLGVPAAAAVAQGPLITIVSKTFDILLLLISATVVGQSFDTDEVDFGPAIKFILIVVILAAVAIVALFAIPKLRKLALPHIKEGFAGVKGSLTDPQRLMKVLGGTLMQKILFALTLGASVAAYGSSISFTEAIFVNSAVSLFVGLVPVPGGIGVGEAALTAGLVAVGVSQEVAFAAAITHRMVTAYLPPVFGWWASRWLTQRDYL